MFFCMKTVLKENHLLIKKVISFSSQFIYKYVIMNMNLLEVVTPPSFYQDISLSLTTLITESGKFRKNYGHIQ